MSWTDCMKLRRIADTVRIVGWVNLTFTGIVALIHASDGWSILVPAITWSALVMAMTHAWAWALDRRAHRVAGR